MRILALDLGLKCGWAFLRTDRPERMESGLWRLDEGQAHLPFLSLRVALLFAIERVGPDLIAFEDVEHLGGRHAHAVRMYGGLRGVLLVTAAESRLTYLGVPIAVVKKAAGLRSHASKEQMVQAAGKRWPGVAFASDDECDARWCAVAASQEPA